MPKGFKQNILGIILFSAAFVPFVLGGAGDLVLCVGENGHIAIEAPHNDPCHESRDHREDHSSASGHSISGGSCCACRDIPLVIDNPDRHLFRDTSPPAGDPVKPGPVCTLPAPADGFDLKTMHLLLRYPHHSPSSLSSLGTTVLRI